MLDFYENIDSQALAHTIHLLKLSKKVQVAYKILSSLSKQSSKLLRDVCDKNKLYVTNKKINDLTRLSLYVDSELIFWL